MRSLIVMALLAAAGATPAFAAPEPLYRVTLDDDLRTLTVQVCFDGVAPATLRAGDAAAADYLLAARWDAAVEARRPQARGARMTLTDAPADACLHYSVDVGRAADTRALRRSGWAGGDLLTTPETWLWRTGTPLVLEFALPEGVSVSAPWQRLADADRLPRYASGATPVRWAAQVAFGRFEERSVALDGGNARVAILDGTRRASAAAIDDWIRRAASGVVRVYGRFPRTDVQVLVVPGGRTGGPVPWAQVLRGGAPAAHFFVSGDATASELNADWTASHELSHLLLPFVRRRDAWLSEGFATYYQNVTRARVGLQTPEQAWQKLLAGFGRGQANMSDASLRDAARDMHRIGSYMRVYWSGAALALLADVALRERDTGEQSLDRILRDLADCCLDDTVAWDARELFAQFDRLGGDGLFAGLYRRHIDSTAFPDVATVLAQLGVRAGDGTTTLDDGAPLARLRDQIMSGRIGIGSEDSARPHTSASE